MAEIPVVAEGLKILEHQGSRGNPNPGSSSEVQCLVNESDTAHLAKQPQVENGRLTTSTLPFLLINILVTLRNKTKPTCQGNPSRMYSHQKTIH